MQESEMK